MDGVYYQVKEGDTLEALAGRFDVKPDDILLWPGNHLDMADPKLTPGEYVLAPGGHREFKQWIVPHGVASEIGHAEEHPGAGRL